MRNRFEEEMKELKKKSYAKYLDRTAFDNYLALILPILFCDKYSLISLGHWRVKV